MDRHPIRARIDPDRGEDREGAGVRPEMFREALSHWAATVTIVAVRGGGHVHATTVSSFVPVSAEPPLILVSLGANAQVLPWLDPGTPFTVNLLARDQQRLASIFADSFPVGPTPFPDEGDPVVPGAVTSLICSVRESFDTGTGARLVLGLVERVAVPDGKEPLLYHRRGYRTLADEG